MFITFVVLTVLRTHGIRTDTERPAGPTAYRRLPTDGAGRTSLRFPRQKCSRSPVEPRPTRRAGFNLPSAPHTFSARVTRQHTQEALVVRHGEAVQGDPGTSLQAVGTAQVRGEHRQVGAVHVAVEIEIALTGWPGIAVDTPQVGGEHR